jgi:hypothetical protein
MPSIETRGHHGHIQLQSRYLNILEHKYYDINCSTAIRVQDWTALDHEDQQVSKLLMDILGQGRLQLKVSQLTGQDL